MAMDLATARQAAQQRGEHPPGGEQPGTPAYDQWVMEWFTRGVDAGDPDLVRRAGGSVAEGGGADDVIAPWEQAAPSSAWLGKRNPTPGELRRYARDTGQSEDYARFSDRQLAAWIGSHWKGDHFENDFGDRVEKPTESGPQSHASGAATGIRGVGPTGGGGGGGGVGGGGARPAVPATPTDYYNPDNPLQARLMQLFQTGGGYMGDVKDRAGMFLKGGGLVWKDRGEEGGLPTAPVPPGSRGIGVTPGGGAGEQRGTPGAFMTNPAAPNPAVTAATLTAFTPSAPSQQGAKPFAPAPATPYPTPATPQTPPPVQPATPQPTPSPTTGTSQSPLSQALSRQYLKPNSWWSGGTTNYTY